MSSIYQEVKDALNSVLGATNITDARNLTASGEVLLATGSGELYCTCFATTGTSAGINIGYQDASATGTGTARLFNLKNISAGVWPVNFDRPIQFTKGLCLSYTASGVASLDVNTVFSPRLTSNSLAPWAPGLR